MDTILELQSKYSFNLYGNDRFIQWNENHTVIDPASLNVNATLELSNEIYELFVHTGSNFETRESLRSALLILLDYKQEHDLETTYFYSPIAYPDISTCSR